MARRSVMIAPWATEETSVRRDLCSPPTRLAPLCRQVQQGHPAAFGLAEQDARRVELPVGAQIDGPGDALDTPHASGKLTPLALAVKLIEELGTVLGSHVGRDTEDSPAKVPRPARDPAVELLDDEE